MTSPKPSGLWVVQFAYEVGRRQAQLGPDWHVIPILAGNEGFRGRGPFKRIVIENARYLQVNYRPQNYLQYLRDISTRLDSDSLNNLIET